jgi:hypothetical protein
MPDELPMAPFSRTAGIASHGRYAAAVLFQAKPNAVKNPAGIREEFSSLRGMGEGVEVPLGEVWPVT